MGSTLARHRTVLKLWKCSRSESHPQSSSTSKCHSWMGEPSLRRLRGPARPPTIIVSAVGAERACRELGAEACMNKPFDPTILVDQIRRLTFRFWWANVHLGLRATAISPALLLVHFTIRLFFWSSVLLLMFL